MRRLSLTELGSIMANLSPCVGRVVCGGADYGTQAFPRFDDEILLISPLSKLARRTTRREPVGESAPRWKRGTPCHMRGF
jgi:hypothetical protein